MAEFSENEVQAWMTRVENWGEDPSPAVLLDISRNIGSLRTFLQQILQKLQLMRSTTEAMETLSFVGQFLGRLCWNPCVIADDRSQNLVQQCLSCLYTSEPQNAIERNANEWIKSLLCHLITEKKGSVAHDLVKRAGMTPEQYYSLALDEVVSLMSEEVSKSSAALPNNSTRCCPGKIHSLSTACIFLVTCPKVKPLIGALLKHSLVCVSSCVNQDFIKEVSEALLSKTLVLEEDAVVALWCHNPSCLEEAAVSLLESVLFDQDETISQSLDKHVNASFLPQTSALHSHIFLIVSEIYRNVLREIDGDLSVRALIQVFTCCFLHRRTGQKPQDRLPLRAFFPNVAPSLLTPLLTTPSDVPRDAWLNHLSWIRNLFQPVADEEEEEEENEDQSRVYPAVLETWFLLVQCGFWVDAAAELLVLASPETSEPLLWLLTFFHHPTNRGHQRTRKTAAAREAWTHLRMLFLPHPPPPRQLGVMKELLSASNSTNLVLHLLLNFTLFSHGPVGIITEIADKVLSDGGVRRRAAWILASIHCRLNRAATLDSRVHSRLRTLQDNLRT